MPTQTDVARMLARYGVVCMRVVTEKQRAKWEKRLWNAMDEFPEYKLRGRGVQRALGGFGALGNPSSFHHPEIQKWRNGMKKEVLAPLFREYVTLKGYCTTTTRLETLYDRLVVRCEAFGQPTPESWHRDIYDGSKHSLRPLPDSLRSERGAEPDEIFGGWVNLSDEPQTFVCLVGSHKGDAALAAQKRGGGFAELSEEDVRKQKVHERLSRQASRKIGTCRTDEKGCVIVPPGFMVLFYQRILHSVAGGKQGNVPSLRVMNGVRLTGETNSLFDHMSVVANNAVPRIPSGQVPPMYSQNHYAFFCSATTSRYRKWGEETFRDQCLFERTVRRTGEKYFTPGSKDDRNPDANRGRYMPSLAEMGLVPYPYTTSSLDTLTPERLF